MADNYEKVKRAVESLPLDEACTHIIYELRSSASAASTAIRLLKEGILNQEQEKEVISLIEQRINQNLTSISDLLVDGLLPRLRKD